jgi:hypothetical protein
MNRYYACQQRKSKRGYELELPLRGNPHLLRVIQLLLLLLLLLLLD